MKTLESFMKNCKPNKRVSCLSNFKDEIMSLYFENYTVQQILEFLKSNKVQISRAALYNFINKNKHNSSIPTPTPVQTKKEMAIVNKLPKPSKPAPVKEVFKKDNKVMSHFMKSVDLCVNLQK